MHPQRSTHFARARLRRLPPLPLFLIHIIIFASAIAAAPLFHCFRCHFFRFSRFSILLFRVILFRFRRFPLNAGHYSLIFIDYAFAACHCR